jgi:hypothetical protein
MITINFTGGINNDSLQIGDMAYSITPTLLGGFQQLNATPIFIGPVIDFFDVNGTSVSQPEWNPPMFSIQVDNVIPMTTFDNSGDFIMFAKDSRINLSGLVGYYAEVYIKNNSTEKAEMFSIASETTPSSK